MLKQLSITDLGQILKTCPMGLAISDGHQKITWVNEIFQNYLGISADEINGNSINELPKVLQPLFNETNTVHIPANSLRDDQWFMCSQKSLEDNSGIVHFITDVGPLYSLMQERESLKDELRESLAIDEVTGMPNKVALFQSLESQISRSRRYNNVLSVVIMRINDLDQLNESQTASLLVLISQMLNDQVRWADIVGKLDDTDFLLVLPETSADACINLCAKLNERLDALEMPEGLPDNFNLTATFGHGEWEKGNDLRLLVQKARGMLTAS